jgi:DNA-binding CsgD family transcriptional regulator
MASATGAKWPTRDDYQSAVLNPQRNLRDTRLHAAQVEMRQMGVIRVPFPRSGNFGAVYKYNAARQSYALKVFAGTQPDRERRYRLVDQHFKSRPPSPSLVSFGYEPEGIRVNGRWFPTLVMDWVEGKPLDLYLVERLQQRGQVDNRALCEAWVKVMLGLKALGVAHGDLQHGNVLVLPDGSLKLVDYDGMFVPAMRQAGLTAAEIGLPAYQHPKRYRGYFDHRLDDFAALVILLSLAALDQERWRRYHTDDNCLIVKESDLLNPEQSPLLAELSRSADAPLKKLATLLKAASAGGLDAIPPFEQVAADGTIKHLLSRSPRPTPARTCARCATELKGDDQFCRGCGAPVGGGKSQVTLKDLTERQREVVALLVDGLWEEQIAQRLHIQKNTVKDHLSKVMNKVGVVSYVDLKLWAVMQGITPPLPPVNPVRTDPPKPPKPVEPVIVQPQPPRPSPPQPQPPQPQPVQPPQTQPPPSVHPILAGLGGCVSTILSFALLFLVFVPFVGLYVIGKILLGYDEEGDLGRAVGYTIGSTVLVLIIGWIIHVIDQRVNPKPKQ